MKEFNPDDYEGTGRRSSGRAGRRGSSRRDSDQKNSRRFDRRPSPSIRKDFRPRFSEDRSMHKVTCDSCGESCEVPFKPTAGKPVFCDACFKKNKPLGLENKHNQSSRELAQINEKLDKILEALKVN